MKLGRWLVAHAKSADSRTSYRIDGIRLETCHQRIARPRIPWLEHTGRHFFLRDRKSPLDHRDLWAFKAILEGSEVCWPGR